MAYDLHRYLSQIEDLQVREQLMRLVTERGFRLRFRTLPEYVEDFLKVIPSGKDLFYAAKALNLMLSTNVWISSEQVGIERLLEQIKGSFSNEVILFSVNANTNVSEPNPEKASKIE